MTELETVERVPDSAVENGFTTEFASDERVIVKWQDDDGTLYTEEFVRNGPPKKEVVESEDSTASEQSGDVSEVQDDE